MANIIVKNINPNLQTIVININGDLSFNSSTNIELSSINFTKAGTYIIITYTGTLNGFANLTITPPAGLTVQEIINASDNKAIKVRLV